MQSHWFFWHWPGKKCLRCFTNCSKSLFKGLFRLLGMKLSLFRSFIYLFEFPNSTQVKNAWLATPPKRQFQTFIPQAPPKHHAPTDHVTASDAIPTSRQKHEKLLWLYENLKCRIISVERLFWKKYDFSTKASLLRILLKNLRALHALEDLEPLFKIFHTFVPRKSRESYRQIYGKSKASIWRNLSTGKPQFFLGQSFAL